MDSPRTGGRTAVSKLHEAATLSSPLTCAGPTRSEGLCRHRRLASLALAALNGMVRMAGPTGVLLWKIAPSIRSQQSGHRAAASPIDGKGRARRPADRRALRWMGAQGSGAGPVVAQAASRAWAGDRAGSGWSLKHTDSARTTGGNDWSPKAVWLRPAVCIILVGLAHSTRPPLVHHSRLLVTPAFSANASVRSQSSLQKSPSPRFHSQRICISSSRIRFSPHPFVSPLL